MASTGTALLILDMVSEFRFEDWRRILAAARPIAPRIAELRRRAHKARIPVFFVNDAGKEWDCDRTELVTRACLSTARGGDVVRQLQPAPSDSFVFKPRHSGFYATPLAELLSGLQVQRLILTGLSSHQCVLFTAVDAHVRDFELVVPRDCIGAPRPLHTRHALYVLREALGARTPLSMSIRFGPARRRPTGESVAGR
jgi:nicotinamidase-related amidase